MKPNRRLFLPALILFIFAFAGCKKLDELTRFNTEYNQTATIPSSTGINLPFNIYTPETATNSSATFSANNTRKDLIEEIKLTALDLRLNAPAGADFSFLKSIQIYISASGLPETRIAWRDNIPADATTLNLEVNPADLKDYIKSDKFTLRLNTVTDELLTADHQLNVHSVFAVDAKILGI